MVGENAPKPDWWDVEPHPDPFAQPEDLTLPRLCVLGEN